MIKEINTYYNDGITKKEVYFVDENGLKQDVCSRFYFSSGNICECYYYVDNLTQGSYKRYNIEGYIEREGFYENGQKEGLWLSFDENGSVKKTDFFIYGKICEENDYKKYLAKKRVNLL